MSKYREDDIELLLPSVRPRVQAVLDDMKALGYKPVLFDTLRRLDQALANAKKGSGVSLSMHLYGCAADIICDDHGWSCAAKKCKFFIKLGAVAKQHGFVWGGDWPKRDMPHIQAVALKNQNAMRALGMSESSLEARDELAQKLFR